MTNGRQHLTLVSDNTAYYAALALVRRIDSDLQSGRGHYRTTSGVLLDTLDQVVRAILANELAEPERLEVAA